LGGPPDYTDYILFDTPAWSFEEIDVTTAGRDVVDDKEARLCVQPTP